jgi:hypothetical protein
MERIIQKEQRRVCRGRSEAEIKRLNEPLAALANQLWVVVFRRIDAFTDAMRPHKLGGVRPQECIDLIH